MDHTFVVSEYSKNLKAGEDSVKYFLSSSRELVAHSVVPNVEYNTSYVTQVIAKEESGQAFEKRIVSRVAEGRTVARDARSRWKCK